MYIYIYLLDIHQKTNKQTKKQKKNPSNFQGTMFFVNTEINPFAEPNTERT